MEKLRILVVDDEETIRELFKEYLREDGFLVKAASSGKEAIETVKAENFDLFLIDLIMPEMDGIELLQEFRRLNIETPAIVLTAYEAEFDGSKKQALNIIGLISKGTPMSEVSSKIRDQIIKIQNKIVREEREMEKEIKILVVDDEKSILDFLKEVVESQGYSFLSAQSGEEAMNKIKEEMPDLVILDIVMPGLDGLEVLQLIREGNKTLPVVILTAYGTNERVKEAMKLNVSGFIPKGISVKEATSKIRTVLNMKLK